jgi:L-malate glycosyltransferase
MNLGFATPVSLQRLRPLVAGGDRLPQGSLFGPAADWVRELIRRGNHITLYTTAPDVSSPVTFHGDSILIRIAPMRLKGTGRDFFAAERRLLEQMMREDRCTLIHAHWTYEFALAALASGIPTLVTIHDQPWKVLSHFRDAHRAARLLMAYKSALRAKYLTAVSAGAAAHFRRYLTPRGTIDVIPNGIPRALFELGRREPHSANEGIRLATVLQGWTRLKNGAAALAAFARARAEIPGATLAMFGLDYEPGGPAQRWADQNHLAEAVSFVGLLPYEELFRRVSTEVDILVHPSLNETFSMTILECMAMRKPVIVGLHTSGMREMLGEDGGVFVDVRDPSSIAQAVIRLAHDVDLRRRLSQRCFERADRMYRLETVMDRYEALYHKILRAEASA